MIGRILRRVFELPAALAQSMPTLRLVASTLARAAAARLGELPDFAMRRPRKVRIGVDIRPFYEPLTGVGWYLHFILRELARQPDIELLLFGDARLTDIGPTLHAALPAGARLFIFDLRGHPLTPLSRPLTAAAYVLWMRLAGCDVFFGANYFLPRLHGAAARRRVVTVHDLTYKRFPELLQKETLENLERQMQREMARADAVICVSASTRRDLLSFYQIDPSRVIAIHSGIEPLVAGPDLQLPLPKRYILFVSTVEPRKNLALLLDAYERLRKSGSYEGSLVIVGRIGWKSAALVERIDRSKWRNDIVRLDYVNPGTLGHVYDRAEMFVFPSIYEGFGFPLLEAMSHGVPSIAARASSLPEIGGEACLYVSPDDANELAAAIRKLADSPELRADLVARGRERVKQFRWEESGRRTADLLRQVARR
jgi:glycosyltransferase involved in cell wall biosynthesis